MIDRYDLPVTAASPAALEAYERDAWAVHAFAHAVYEMAAFETGLARLPSAIHPCGTWAGSGITWCGT